MNDKELIQKVVSGDMQAFKLLVERHQEMVFRVAIGFVHSKEDAEDLTQDIFIKVYDSLKTFRQDSEFSTWLYRITVNYSINHIRKNKKNSLLDSLETIFNKVSPDKTPIEEVEEKERDLRIKNAIDKLNPRQRTAFVLSNYEELSQKEIATIMKTSEGAVEQLLQRAKAKLREILTPNVGK
ncbi:MAG: RNA polymerase sigma factor [Lentimicrobiaceae bacterium]|nr:RNA polymerase sigma factor [Lentimicrobiaceae bacterium]